MNVGLPSPIQPCWDYSEKKQYHFTGEAALATALGVRLNGM